MENQINFIINQARRVAPYHVNSEEELREILKSRGSENFITLGDVLFSVNEYGILEGIGFDSMGNFKIWNNSKFGTFKQESKIINNKENELQELQLFLQKTAIENLNLQLENFRLRKLLENANRLE